MPQLELGDRTMVDVSGYDFIDFGCSSGGSIKFAKKYFKGQKELGIDLDPKKVEQTRKAGFEAQVADLTQLNQFTGRVRFSILSHVLEYMPDATSATQVIRTAIAISRRFVFIRQPYFDADGYLASMGLKCYWSDWSGHKNHMNTMQIYQAIAPAMKAAHVKGFEIYGHKKVISSDSPDVLPIDAPVNQHAYDLEKHGPKQDVPLTFPVYREMIAIVYLNEDPSTRYVQKLFPEAELLLSRVKEAS